MKITIISDKDYTGDALALIRALKAKEITAELILPLYEGRTKAVEKLESLGSFNMMMPFGNVKISVYTGETESLPCIYIYSNLFLKRNESFYDDAQRISVFCHGALETLKYIKSAPDYIFTDSYRTAVIPVLMKLKYRFYEELNCVKTLHYINDNEYGIYNRAFAGNVFGVDKEGSHILMASNEVNLTKGAILCASRIFVGERGISILYDRNSKVHHAAVQFGFKVRRLNMGLDYSVYDPQRDSCIHRNYSSELLGNKKYNKFMIQRHFRFIQDESVPLIAIYPHGSRELMNNLIKNISRREIQMIILCRENESYKNIIPPIAKECFREIKLDLLKIRNIAAASDMLLMSDVGSDFGNIAYIACAYGCVPIVPSQKYFDIGISYFNKITLEGNGYTYDKHIKDDVIYTLWDALGIYRHDKKTFTKLIQNCMKNDFSVDCTADQLLNETEKSPYFQY